MADDVAGRLHEASPFGLLAFASGLIEATTRRPLDDIGLDRRERPDGPAVFTSFAQCGWPEMEALALAVATLHSDEVLARRLRRAVSATEVPGAPRWLTWMDDVEITEVMVQDEVLGDGENILVTWRWPDGQTATLIVFVDHNMGSLVKDAFVIPDDIEGVEAAYADIGDGELRVHPLDPAEARARVAEGIDAFEHTLPVIDHETWPTARPLVEWLMRKLPAGGRGYERPEWSDAARADLLDEFASSEFGRIKGLSRQQVIDLADPLVWFACDYGPGDPLRWSPVSVEIVLIDWYPRKVFGLSQTVLRRLPDVLAGFVAFAHDRRDIPAHLTAHTVDAVELWRQDYLVAVRRPGRSRGDNAARLARLVAGFDRDEVDEGADGALGEDVGMEVLIHDLEEHLTDLVGGPEAYRELHDDPLGDVPFDWSRVPDDVQEAAGEVLALMDRWASQLFDDEVRTIARGVLAGVVAADPAVLKRSPNVDRVAAAILSYLVRRLTGRFSAAERSQLPWKVTTQKALAEATDVPPSALSSRTRTIANIVERADIDWPAMLHSTQRREALVTKQRVAEWRARRR